MNAKLHSAAEQRLPALPEENNWKYNLLGDPAMTLRVARREVRFETAGD